MHRHAAPLILALAALATGCSSAAAPTGAADMATAPTPDMADIAAPPLGVQIKSPEFAMQPGEEVFKCFYTSLPSNVDVNAIELQSHMSAGSHHFILYTTTTAAMPDGTLVDCPDSLTTGIQNLPVWTYASQTPDNSMKMPDGVGLPFKAHQPLLFNMHYINASTQPIMVHVTQNITFTTDPVQRAGAFVSYNAQISIPPHGDQTVSGHCPPPAGARFFALSTHSHMRTVSDEVHRYAGGQSMDLLVQTNDWEHPTVATWNPQFLTFPAGQEIQYTCSYHNDSNLTITDGESATKNEMCMAVGYFFPATATRYCFNSFPIDL